MGGGGCGTHEAIRPSGLLLGRSSSVVIMRGVATAFNLMGWAVLRRFHKVYDRGAELDAQKPVFDLMSPAPYGARPPSS